MFNHHFFEEYLQEPVAEMLPLVFKLSSEIRTQSEESICL